MSLQPDRIEDGPRAQIKPALRQVWRGPGTLQIGLDPRRGTVLDGLDATDLPLVRALAKGRIPRVDSAAPPSSPRWRELVALLAGAGVLITRRTDRTDRARLQDLGPARGRLGPDAAAWSLHGDDDGWARLVERQRRLVRVVGAGRLGTTIAATLAAAGIGRVQVIDSSPVVPGDVTPAGAHPGDVGLLREDAARAALDRLGRPHPEAARSATAHPDLVVLVEPDAADAAAAGPLVTADVPHLSVVVREGTVVVGPLVLPGRSACLCCLDLHRRDRDPAWPRILTQLLRARGQGGLPAAEETASTQLGASLAALQVLAALDDNGPDHRPAAVSATLEVELPDGLLGRREWQVHPACGCLRLPR